MDIYLRLRRDGLTVTQIHTDRGSEFCSEVLEKWCLSRTILHTHTPGDQPQSNGRVEASVQWIKAEIRRILHAADAPFSLWPLAARDTNE
jgi:transposase InsO family protein